MTDNRHPKQKTFVDPYGHIRPESDPTKPRTTGRVVSDIDINLHRKLLAIRPSPRGVIQTTVNILLSKLDNELTRHGITDYSHCDEFERFVTGLKLVDGREAVGVTDGEASSPNDGGGATRTGEILPTKKVVTSVSARGDQSGSKRGRKRGKG